MSNYVTAFNFLMTSEDSLLKYQSVPDPVVVEPEDAPDVAEAKRNAHAISGINSFYFPSQFEVINAQPQASRGPLVQAFYEEEFWNHWLQEIDADDTAMRVFDSSVNQGQGTAVRLLQQAVNSISSQSLTVDGGWGTLTVEAVNRCDVTALVSAFKAARADRYRQSAARNPKAPLAGWLARAEK